MSFDALSPSRPQKIAVIGGGISGLATAWKLAQQHDVTLYEAAPRLGGHARTVMAGLRGDQPVDTGFIVFNYANYPHLTAMFRDLDVPVERSDMSFGATIADGRIEYGLRDVAAVFGQRRNLLRPGFAGMIRDILRFNAGAEAMASDDAMTVGELMQEMRLGPWFRDYYLQPICGAIWSTPPDGVARFPARALLRFFRNHALLSASGQHQWWTVSGGSIQYVDRVAAALARMGVSIRTGTPVGAVRRSGPRPEVVTGIAAPEAYDQVVLACHPDQALRLLARPTFDEHQALSAIRYQDNDMVLHRDVRQMPRRRACWSSWVYQSDGRAQPRIGVTYWMNKLQNIDPADPMFVTLNPAKDIPDALTYDRKTFRHPVFDGPALKAQQRIATIQGQNATWFAGAWLRHGFHEDGFASAMRIVRQIDPALA